MTKEITFKNVTIEINIPTGYTAEYGHNRHPVHIITPAGNYVKRRGFKNLATAKAFIEFNSHPDRPMMSRKQERGLMQEIADAWHVKSKYLEI